MSDIHIYLEREQPVKVITLEPTGARGPIGPQGATGPAGPNSVTSATTSDGTAVLSVAEVVATASGNRIVGIYASDEEGRSGSLQFSDGVNSVGIIMAENSPTADLVLPSSSGTIALTSDIPTDVNNITSATTSDGTAELSIEKIAVGPNSVANGSASAAIGECTTSATYAFAVGYQNTASGGASFAAGSGSTASGYVSFANGGLCVASADFAHAAGFRAKAIHNGASVESDSEAADAESTTTDEKTFRFANGYRFLGGSASFSGAVTASNLSGTNTGDQDLSGLVAKSDYTPSHSILAQQSGTGSPTAVTLGNNTILGRMAGGGSAIAGLSASDARTVMGLGTLATVNGGTGVADFLASPTSANLAAAVTGETGMGPLVFATLPTLVTPNVRQNNASFTPLVIGAGGTHVATFADNVNAITGLQMGNVNTGNLADFRFLIKDTTDHYFTFSVPSTGNVSTLFGLTRNSTDYIFNSGGTARDMAIGTADAKFLILATSATERLRVSATGEVGIGTSSPSTRAVLDLTSTTRGFLPPRMTTAQRDAITSVPAGLMIYNTSTNKLNFFNGTAWEAVTSA
jgi:hypothetical protein